ncbi:MAG: Fic family protein [Deltaproteobacteria bacterium]|jgi:cell filamentation protein|nr:Fic family protein [Deltaproteobacteria bacterium]
MANDYNHEDPDLSYTDPVTGVLRNKLNIADKDALREVEFFCSIKGLARLRDNPVPIKDIDSLFAIHKRIFQEIYDWAGEPRKVEINKGGTLFFTVARFNNAMVFINGLLAEFKSIDYGEKARLSGKLAEILDTLNFFHPFREGNGRAQREFIRTLALEKGWELDLGKANSYAVYVQYMKGSINEDVKLFHELIFKIMKKMK